MAKILVVENDRLYRLVVVEALREAGYEALGAADGGEARKSMSTEMDLALFDGQLPDMSGLTLLEELKAAHPDCPAIVVTAHPIPKDEAKAMSLGAFRYMEKPRHSCEILAVVQLALNAAGRASP